MPRAKCVLAGLDYCFCVRLSLFVKMKLLAVASVCFLIFSDFVVVVLGQIDSSCRAANRAAVPTNWEFSWILMITPFFFSRHLG